MHLRTTRTFTSCEAVAVTDADGIVRAVFLQDFSHDAWDTPEGVRRHLGRHVRQFDSIAAATNFLFEVGAVISQMRVLLAAR